MARALSQSQRDRTRGCVYRVHPARAHNPKLTPGFAGKLIYTTVRYPEWGSEGGNAKELLAHAKGPIESAGWYQDAGDWDSYETHLRVAQELLLAYELAPKNFRDGELNIPESRNGVPDILDEAAWLPRFCQRLRHELLRKGYGTGGIGLRIAGDAFGDDEKTLPDGKKVGQGSWEDVHRTWAASGEDPMVDLPLRRRRPPGSPMRRAWPESPTPRESIGRPRRRTLTPGPARTHGPATPLGSRRSRSPAPTRRLRFSA